nr:biotin--[acetyl-CoA-carboxylase] ligase [Stagnihabitans tardus]
MFETLDSTNAHALRMGVESFPAWVLAHEQSAGRGRRARAWASPRGNFHASLLLAPSEPPATVALRSFAAALALRDAFTSLTETPQAFALKWPNDVLCNGAKIAGILLEANLPCLAIGIGVNLIAAPDPALLDPDALPPTTLLAATGLRVTPETFLDALAPAYDHWERLFQTQGFAPLREAWLQNAAKLNEPIRARTGSQTLHGTFRGLDETGALLLQTAQGLTPIPAAEVFF